MAALCLPRKTLFVLFLPSKTSILQAISKAKMSLEPLCLNANENCDVNVAIDRAGYQSARQKTTSWVFFVLSLGQSHLRVFMVAFFCCLYC